MSYEVFGGGEEEEDDENFALAGGMDEPTT